LLPDLIQEDLCAGETVDGCPAAACGSAVTVGDDGLTAASAAVWATAAVSAAGAADVGLDGVLHQSCVPVVNRDIVWEATAAQRKAAVLCGIVCLNTILVDLDVCGLVHFFIEAAKTCPGHHNTQAEEPVLVLLRELGTMNDVDVFRVHCVDHSTC